MNSRLATLTITIALYDGERLQVPNAASVSFLVEGAEITYQGRLIGVAVGALTVTKEREE